MVAVGEFGLPGSGNTDVLAFSAEGDIAIIECKLAANPESRRKVIGQILEYASFLWGMSYREVDSRVRQRKGKSLPELIDDAVAGEWDQASFEGGIAQSLEEGKFTLIIVVDEINDELRRIIRYVNECSKSSFSLHALEMRRFRAGGVEILVPQLYGLSVKPRASTEKRRKWTKEEFLVAFRSNVEPNAAVIVENLYEWAEDTADRVWLGSGTETGSFSFHYLKDGRTLPVFSAYTNGRLSLNYGGLSEQVGNKEVLEEFHRRITEIPTFRGIPADFSRWPSVRSAEVFRDPEALTLEAFKQVVEWFGSTVKAA